MIEGLKPYAEYKESGQEWLGKVPAHWRTPRIKTVLREKDARSLDGSGLLLSLTRNRGLIDRSDMTDKIHSARTLAGYKLYEPGEIVMNRMQAWSGMFGAGNKSGLVSPDYAVFKLLGGDLVTLLLARLKSPDLVSQFALESKGIGSGFNRLYSDKFGAIAISLPPPDEQAAIVRFLDHANRKIDGFIRAKRKLIGLLNEQKQAIIHRAVTRGLHPDVPLKPSGIPWLGDIPQHWDVLRAKYVFREMDERSKTGNEEQLSVSHITGVTPRSQKNVTMFKAESYVGHKVCRSGDLAVNTMWAWMAALGVSKYEGIISPAYAVYRQRKPERLLSDYADHLLRIAPYKLNYQSCSTGLQASRLRLYPDAFFRIPIILPPKDEQQQIVDSISVETAALTTAIARTEREIALMQEYRTRLTADLVTGKLDVREAAAKLPEVEPEPAADEALEEPEMEEAGE